MFHSDCETMILCKCNSSQGGKKVPMKARLASSSRSCRFSSDPTSSQPQRRLPMPTARLRHGFYRCLQLRLQEEHIMLKDRDKVSLQLFLSIIPVYYLPLTLPHGQNIYINIYIVPKLHLAVASISARAGPPSSSTTIVVKTAQLMQTCSHSLTCFQWIHSLQ